MPIQSLAFSHLLTQISVKCMLPMRPQARQGEINQGYRKARAHAYKIGRDIGGRNNYN